MKNQQEKIFPYARCMRYKHHSSRLTRFLVNQQATATTQRDICRGNQQQQDIIDCAVCHNFIFFKRLKKMVKTQVFVAAAFLAGANAFSGNQMPSNEAAQSARRDFLKTTAATTAAAILSTPTMANAAVEVPDQVTSYEYPKDWGLGYKYDEDAEKVRAHMYLATTLGKGAENMEDYGKNMKKEMVDFVSYYRRFPQIAGKPSFSTLYTSINVLAGHYTSYGYKYPLPEKRRKRLYQEYAEISKSLKRGR